MAATKLTLKLEKTVIERGKAFARQNGMSLSKMFEQFIIDTTRVSTSELEKYKPTESLLAICLSEPTPSMGVSPQQDVLDYYAHKEEQYERLGTEEE